jgi:hypothetical protein
MEAVEALLDAVMPPEKRGGRGCEKYQQLKRY